MLKITLEQNSRFTTLRVEGRLTGPWVQELQRAWRAAQVNSPDGRAAVDLTDVTFVGEDGKALLEVMHAEGAKLKATGCVTKQLVVEIEQNFTRTHPKQIVVSSD